jgi:hydrogenase-4 component B
MPLGLVVAAACLAAMSGFPSLFLRSGSTAGQRISVVLICISSALGIAGAFSCLLSGASGSAVFPWPALGDSLLGLDALSAFFLVPVFLVGGLGAIYGLGYWPASEKGRAAQRLQVFWGLLVAGMAILLAARQAMAFLFGWELMALASFFLITVEDSSEECRAAGWIYFIAAHVSSLLLFGLFSYWKSVTGSFDFVPAAPGLMSPVALALVFITALVAFGLKAGIMPLHFWLPGAHAASPSHVSAILSGVVLKMGVYGLIRFIWLLPDPPVSWGALVLIVGAVSGICGVAFAIAQHDLKRLLAYHSVENIGIIMMGFGLALMGKSRGNPLWIALGLGGCLLHVWNHGLFKSLLFLGAGSVARATGTREIDRLGGLAKRMPWTAGLFLVGAVAICGLPPLNGFVSEFLIYLGLFRSATAGALGAGFLSALAVPSLAMIGALALACFVKVFGIAFLGESRSADLPETHEAPFSMLAPMGLLALLCVTIGVAPSALAPVLDSAMASLMPPALAPLPSLASLAPLSTVGLLAIALLALVFATSLPLLLAARKKGRVLTWDCGYARPTARMQYTASSFAQPIVGLFGFLIRPKVNKPRIEGAFPGPSEMSSRSSDRTLDGVIMPASREIGRRFGWFRRFQQGLAQQYVLYIAIAAIVLLLALVPVGDLLAGLF